MFGGIPEGYEDNEEIGQVAGKLGTWLAWDEESSEEEVEEQEDREKDFIVWKKRAIEMKNRCVHLTREYNSAIADGKTLVQLQKNLEVDRKKSDQEKVAEITELKKKNMEKEAEIAALRRQNGEKDAEKDQEVEYWKETADEWIKKSKRLNEGMRDISAESLKRLIEAQRQEAETRRQFKDLQIEFEGAQKKIKGLEDILDEEYLKGLMKIERQEAETQHQFKNLQVEFEGAQKKIKDLEQQEQQQRDGDLAEAHKELTKRHNQIVELNQQVNKYKQERDKHSVDFFRELKAREKVEEELRQLREKPKPSYTSIAAQTVPQHRASQVN